MVSEALSSFIYGFSVYRNKIPLMSAVLAFLVFLLVGYFIVYGIFNLFIHDPLVQTGLYVYSYSVAASSALFIVILLVVMYLVNLSLNAQRKPEIREALHASNSTYLRFLILSSTQLIASVVGTALLIVPGFYLGTKLLFLGASSIYYDDILPSVFSRTLSITKTNSVASFLLFLLYFAVSAVLIYVAMIVSSSVFISYIIYSFIASFVSISFFSSTYRLLYVLSNRRSGLEEIVSGYTGREDL